jgi:hypothetical protein
VRRFKGRLGHLVPVPGLTPARGLTGECLRAHGVAASACGGSTDYAGGLSSMEDVEAYLPYMRSSLREEKGPGAAIVSVPGSSGLSASGARRRGWCLSTASRSSIEHGCSSTVGAPMVGQVDSYLARWFLALR